jgi:hypothetical protein
MRRMRQIKIISRMNKSEIMTYAARRLWIKQQLALHQIWPTAQEILNQFLGTSRATAYRDLKAVVEELSQDVDVERLRLQVLSRLGSRIPNLGDKDLVRLACQFLPHKIEQKSEVELKGRLSDEDRELLKQYATVIERIAEQSLSKDHPTK